MAAVVYFYGARCPSCGARGTSTFVSSEVVSQEPAYGLVTRKDTISSEKGDSYVYRKERVPIIKTTTRTHYQCRNCQHYWYRDRESQREDFSRKEATSEKQTIIV